MRVTMPATALVCAVIGELVQTAGLFVLWSYSAWALIIGGTVVLFTAYGSYESPRLRRLSRSETRAQSS